MADWSYRCEYVRCGKPSCRSCPHGPYWYGYRRTKEGFSKKYFGKKDPREPVTQDEWRQMPAGRIEEYEPIFSRRTATLAIAEKILSVDSRKGFEICKKVYWELSKKFHPDRCDDDTMFKYVSAAWSYMKYVMSW